MRIVLLGLVVLLLAFAGYAYSKNPAACRKIGRDTVALVRSLLPNAPPSGETADTTSASEDNPDSTPPTPPSTKSPPPALPAPAVASATNAPPVAVVPAPAPPSPPASEVTPAPRANSPAPSTPEGASPENRAASEPKKPWAPPEEMPAQANWTWITSDGKTYEQVIVTKIEPDTVTITHSNGTARVPIATLAPSIQKQMNYDPAPAVRPVGTADVIIQTGKVSSPSYYTMVSVADAETAAQQRHLPLAWLSTRKKDITATTNPDDDDEITLTQFALHALQDRTVIIFIDAETEMNQTPALVHHQFSERDDGVLPGNANYISPKIVFSNPDATTILGRVSYTQMKADAQSALDHALASIPKKGTAPAGQSAPATPQNP